MRKMKKIASLMMALVMVMAMSVTALAATVTVDNAVVGETYSIYKIFDAVYSEDLDNDGEADSVTYTITSDSDWYSAVSSETSVFTLTPLSTDNGVTTYQVELVSGVFDTAVIAVFTAVDTTSFTPATTDITPTTENPDVEWTGLGAGYYFVTSSLGSLVSVDTAGTATITDKNDTNDNLTKTVKDAEGNVITSASIGDELTYVITDSVPLVWSNQTMTEYTFADTLPDGLTYNNDVTVTIKGTDDDGGEAAVTLSGTDYITYNSSTNTLTVTFKPQTLNGYPTKDATITITYTATLNENAETATTNTVTSSLNTNGVTETVYTYGFNLKKVAASTSTELSGAEFTLKDSSGATIGFIKTIDPVTNAVTYTVSTNTTDSDYTKTITVGSALIFGLEAGTYTLTETVAPTGYNLLDDPITVEVGTDGSYNTQTGINTTVQTVENSAGTALPSTGGIGTTIFYIVGTVLVLGAAVVLITRRRMSSEA